MARSLLLALAVLAAPCAVADADAMATMQRMQDVINQGVAMAAQGANLVGQTPSGSAALDAAAAEQGRELIARGKALIVEAASGKSMMQLHSLDLSTQESARMIAIHRLESAALAYIKVLESQ